MSEEFKEENTKGEIIDGEQEGWGWGDIFRRFKPKPSVDWGAIRRRQEEERRNRERAEREQREREQRARDEANRVANLETQVRQLIAQVRQLESIIREKDMTIDRKNKHIAWLTRENTRLRKKVNSLLDNLQYYRTLVLGNREVDGYQKTVVKQQIKNDELIQQEIGKPIQSNKTEGFQSLYENYENFQSEFNNLQNEYKNLEGFVDQITSSYNSVFIENQAVQNQIENSTNVYSVNNQLSSNIIAKTNYLKQINFILILLFLIVYVYGCYKIYKIEGIHIVKKVIIGLFMFLTIFIIHLIEYILVYTVPYISALLLGTPYNPPYLFNKPGKYDYLPTP
jgi:DNA repair exonuclease SbcCD ATPase subunit